MIFWLDMTNRTGSEWLCRMLRSAGVDWAGEPAKVNTAEWWPEFRRQHTIIGLKVNTATRDLVWPLLGEADRAEAKHIYLYRLNVLRQAMSQYRAERSQVWHLGREEATPASHGAVEFDRKAVLELARGFQKENRRWKEWFRANGIEPLCLCYEDLTIEPVWHVQRILAYLGLPDCEAVDTFTDLRPTADALTESWMLYFPQSWRPQS